MKSTISLSAAILLALSSFAVSGCGGEKPQTETPAATSTENADTPADTPDDEAPAEGSASGSGTTE